MSTAGASRRLTWTLQRTLLGLRWPGLLGLALLVLSAAAYVAAVIPQSGRAVALEREAGRLSSQLNARGGTDARPTPRNQLSSFFGFFPVVESLPALLGKVQRAAKDNGLDLEKGEYKVSHERDFPLSRYQITLPVKGTYPQVRAFVNDVLAGVPAAALEDLTLKRETAGDPQVEARVRFTVFLASQ